MRNGTCLLDHHQRSHYDTITIGPDGKFHWVLCYQQSEGKIVRQSRGEVEHATFSQLTQSQNQSVIDQGNLRTQNMFLLLKVKRPIPMRSMKKVFTKNSVLQIDQGNLRLRLAWLKLTICLKTSELSKLTMDQGNLMSVTARKHKMLLKYIVKLRHSTRTTSSIVKSTRKTSTSTVQDYHIPP